MRIEGEWHELKVSYVVVGFVLLSVLYKAVALVVGIISTNAAML